MVKFLIGLTVVMVIAAAGFFGFQFYVQQRIAGEVEAAFAQIRASGSQASHGRVSFDLRSGTVQVADIALESTAPQPVNFKIGNFIASGVSQPDPARFSAANIDAIDVEVSGSMATQPGWHVTYKAPRIVVKDYSGPAGPLRHAAASSAAETWRFVLEQFAAISAASITAPSLVATFDDRAATRSSDYAASGLALRDIQGGKITAMTVQRTVFTAHVPLAGKSEQHTGEIADVALYDFDANAAAAMLDPAPANDDAYYRIYRQMKAGAYTLTLENGPRVQIEEMTVDGIEARPSRIQLAALMTLMPSPGTSPPPAQAHAMMDKMAGAYAGLRIGNAEMHGITVDTPEGPFKLAALRFNMDNGKIGEFALEGLDAHSPDGPVKLGRFALKSLDVANLLRTSSQRLATPAAMPSPDQMFGLLPLLEGAEVNGLVAPYKDSTAPVSVENLSLDWGAFVGPIPTKARLSAKLSIPIVATDPTLKMLAASGLDQAAIKLDLGGAWSEGAHSFVLEPAMAELGGVLSATARVSLGNVPREVFSTNPLQATIMATQIEAGTVEMTLHDLGGIDLGVAQFARTQMVSREAARQAIAAGIRANGKAMAATAPDATKIAEALARFVENPGGTLAIKLTPQGTVPAIQLFAALKTDPLTALARFGVEASTGR